MKWGGGGQCQAGLPPALPRRRRGAAGGRLREVWAWQAQGKEPVSQGKLADGITGSEPAGTKHKIRPAH